MTKHNLELFSADCKLCEHTINVLEQATKDNRNLELIIHRASECVDDSCCKLAEKYGIYAVPSLVVDGNLVKVGKIENFTEVQYFKIINCFRGIKWLKN